MNTPQIILIILMSIAGGINMAWHDKPQPNYNFWAWLIRCAVWTGLLVWGGFFS